jgi:predicted transcriptional regulator
MKLAPRKAISVARAREVLSHLDIQEPDEIDVARIAAYYGVHVREEPLAGMDGRIVRDETSAIVTVRESIDFSAQKRFVIAHELGHFFLHPKARQIEMVNEHQTMNWSEKQEIEEYEANLFAAELLMPQALFKPRISNEEPSFALIEKLSHDFQTTFTATAVQYVFTTREECALISCAGRQRLWAVRSPGFSFQMLEDNYVHGLSCAAEVLKTHKTARASDVEAGFWLDGFYDNHKAVLTEEARYFPSLERTLSLIWIYEDL